MRVVLDGRVAIDHFPGIGRVAVSLAEAMLRVAPGLDLVVLEDTSAPPETRKAIAAPRAPVAASVFAASQQWRVPACLKALGADVYHSLFYLMPYRPGVPTVFTCHDLIPLRRPDLFPIWKRIGYDVGHRLAIGASRAVLAISESTARDVRERYGLPAGRVRVVPLAVGPEFAPPDEAEAARVRALFDLPGRYLLYVGTNRPHKNLPRLVAAYARARQEDFPPLLVAGPFSERHPEARLEAERLPAGSVRFLGPVASRDLPALYGGALAFVFPSEIEGFGLPVLEAMASGAPTITSNVSALPEVAGDAALLVPPHDVDAIAAALRRIVLDADLRATLRARGFARAASFTWERAARDTLAAYEAVR
jgi:alpha-1,3-rhamnosyl/mannosyltransferase